MITMEQDSCLAASSGDRPDGCGRKAPSSYPLLQICERLWVKFPEQPGRLPI